MRGVLYLFIALGLTWAVECPTAALWFRKCDVVWAVFLVNMLTNPLINAEMMIVAYTLGYKTSAYWVILALSELAVVVTEGILLSVMLKISKKRTFIFCLIANVLSYFTGVLLEVAGIL